MTHCARELFHAQWDILLDSEFVDAWENGELVLLPHMQYIIIGLGFVVNCADEVKHRVYPRILSYSADYPEKYTQCPAIFLPPLLLL
jgi:hypothetical protein